jgi:hypothetical protein
VKAAETQDKDEDHESDQAGEEGQED